MASGTEEGSKAYPGMILEAISALNDKNGCNKSAISKYTETKYGNLLPSHWSLLTAHLAGMKDSGSLLFIKNNYFKPGSDEPRKPKLLPRGTILPPPRPRGRPPSPRTPTPPPSPSSPLDSPGPTWAPAHGRYAHSFCYYWWWVSASLGEA